MKVLVYTLRPVGGSLWLTPEVAKAIGAKDGDRLTEDQFSSRAVQELIAERLDKKGRRGDA